MTLSSLLSTYRRGSHLVHLIEPAGPINYKLNRAFNTNYANISNRMRQARRLYLSGSSQKVQSISRFNGGNTQFGNFYLGQPLSLNYLGRMEGQIGGSGQPPRNSF